MRGVVIYVRYLVIPAFALFAAVCMAYIISRTARKFLDRRNKKNRR